MVHMAAASPGNPRSVPLDYFRQSNGLLRWKNRLAGLALVLTLIWLAFGWVRGDRGRSRYSPGSLAVVHATWNDQCAACHVDFVPINRSAGVGRLLGDFHGGDSLCINCHAGPPHSPFQIAAEVRDCADCHREHRGRDASLVRLPDRDCVSCHADLNAHVQSPHTALIGNVSRFAANDHPEFRLLRDRAADPGRLNFNHQVHLTPGMGGGKPLPGAKIPFTLAGMDAADRDRYRQPGQDPINDSQNVVQLNCASCHQLPTDGAYMRPITYENQCRACHPLTLEESPGKKPWAVPHRLQPDALHQLVEGVLVSRYLAGKPAMLAEPFAAPRQLPGKPVSKEMSKAIDFINGQLAVAETRLYVGHQTCGECHQFTTPTGVVTPADVAAGGVPKFKVQPTAMPAVWLTRARFNHKSHRAMKCADCHANAEKSQTSRDVLLPGIDNCMRCHAPGGSRSDCTECHQYHHPAR